MIRYFAKYNVFGVEFEPQPSGDANSGIYVFGSYDARKWALLGHKEKQGTFRDLGCLVERTDCKFFRICLAGQFSKDSRLDYFELSAKESPLSKKIR